MRQLLCTVLPFLLVACAAHRAPEPVGPAAPSAPHLPAPVADLYVRHIGQPVDPLVVQVLGGRPWEEVLSGAASGVALALVARGEVDLSAARWAAIRAGYPFPVLTMDVVHVEHDVAPSLNLPSDGDLGLVRARGPDDDIWVVLRGAGGPDLPRLPREARVGDFVPLSGASWRAASPDGATRTLEHGVLFDQAGEWLLQAVSEGRILATLPVYVGEPTPDTAPFAGELSGEDPEEATFNALASVWEWYGREPPVRDTGMDSVARVRLRALGEAGTPESSATLLKRAGYVDGANGAECQAASLRECLEQMWWSPDQRAIYAGDFNSVGVATSSEGRGVRVVVMVAK